MNHELRHVQAGFRKGRAGSLKKRESSRKIIYFCFIDCAKAFDCVDHNKLENSLREGIQYHLTCLLRNLYAGQKATVRTERLHSLSWHTVTTRLFVIWEWGNLCARDIRPIEFKETLRNKVIRTLLRLFNVTYRNFNCMKISY